MYTRLQELRLKQNLTKNEISKVLEIPSTLYSLYENGKKAIPISILSKLAKFYNTSIDYIVGDTDQQKPYK